MDDTKKEQKKSAKRKSGKRMKDRKASGSRCKKQWKRKMRKKHGRTDTYDAAIYGNQKTISGLHPVLPAG